MTTTMVAASAARRRRRYTWVFLARLVRRLCGGRAPRPELLVGLLMARESTAGLP